jgi:hypothetical protein
MLESVSLSLANGCVEVLFLNVMKLFFTLPVLVLQRERCVCSSKPLHNLARKYNVYNKKISLY